jgi:hypothetical protein
MISAFAPILWLKNEAEFTWGADQQCDFDDIKKYLSSPPVIKAPMVGIPFRLYIITYLSWHLIDAEIRYSFIEKLCLFLFYACSKLRYYLLSSTCVVACQADVIRHMVQ